MIAVPDEVRAQLPQLRRIAVEVATQAARLVADGRREALAAESSVQTKSTRTDVVTAMDQECERFVRARLAQLRPGDAVLGEEAGAQGEPGAVTWVVDPIDGTVNFLYGRPEYAVSVAAVTGDPRDIGASRSLAGAVVNVATGEIYDAHLGGGATRTLGEDVEQLRVNPVDDLGLALLATGFGYAAEVRAEQARALTRILPAVRDIRRGGSAALDLCTVATGVVDAYAEVGVHVWDVAAGRLVAEEAGARVAVFDAERRGIMAAAPGVAEALGHLVTEAYDFARRTGSDGL